MNVLKTGRFLFEVGVSIKNEILYLLGVSIKNEILDLLNFITLIDELIKLDSDKL